MKTCAPSSIAAASRNSRAQRTRALAAAALGTLVLYQPLASLGVLPLTGITWPGLGLDSPTDLWLLMIATPAQ